MDTTTNTSNVTYIRARMITVVCRSCWGIYKELVVEGNLTKTPCEKCGSTSLDGADTVRLSEFIANQQPLGKEFSRCYTTTLKTCMNLKCRTSNNR